MGYSFWSKAEVVTTEPEKVKDLILQIVAEGETTSVYNLEIKGNSIFFDSDGYGRYGISEDSSWDDEGVLFARLCEEYTGALVCFEAATPCNGYDYYLSTVWMKPEGVLKPKSDEYEDDEEYEYEYKYNEDDVDDEIQTFYRICEVLWWEDLDFSKDCGYYEPEFKREFNECCIGLWFIEIDKMEKYKDEMPDLYNAYIKAKADGFDDWIVPVWCSDKSISYDVAEKIGELYSDDKECVIQDCFNHMKKYISNQSLFYSASPEFELPENFPKLSQLQ